MLYPIVNSVATGIAIHETDINKRDNQSPDFPVPLSGDFYVLD